MRTRRNLTAIVAAAIAGLALAACNPNSTTGASNNAPSAGTTTTTSAAASGNPAAADTKPVPALIGKGLQTAQDAAQAAGFYFLTSHDSLGRDRMQLLDRDWKVCSQTPAAGASVSTDTKLDFGAVKLDETCPAADVKEPEKTGKTMPNFVGKGLKAARESLPDDAAITENDAVGDRSIILESNWKVCTQDPKAGAAYTGQPVTFTAVKTDETCP